MVAHKYKYIQGLAEISQAFDSQKVDVWVTDHGDLIGHCDYCGARLRYKHFFDDGKNSIGIGCCCAEQLSRYLNMPPELVKKALSFFKKYEEAARKAGVTGYRVSLKELDKSIADLKRQLKEAKENRFKEYEQVVATLQKDPRLNYTERVFVSDVASTKTLTVKQAEWLKRIANEVQTRDDGLALARLCYEMADSSVLGSWYYNFSIDVYRRSPRYISEKQRAILLKILTRLAKYNPDNLEAWLNEFSYKPPEAVKILQEARA